MKTQAELTELVYAAMPYNRQISELAFEPAGAAIRFLWRGVRYRVSDNCMVEEVGDGVLIGSDRAILLQHLLEMKGAHR